MSNIDRTDHTLQLIKTAKLAVDQELERCTVGTGTVGTLSQLTTIRKKLEAMEVTILSDAMPPQSNRDRGMGHMISDSWPLGSTLGEIVLSAEEAYVRL